MLVACVYSSSTPSYILQVSLRRWNTPRFSYVQQLEVVLRLCTKIQTQRVVLSCVRGCYINYLNPPSKVVFQFTSSTILRITTVFFLDFFWGVDLISVGDTLLLQIKNKVAKSQKYVYQLSVRGFRTVLHEKVGLSNEVAKQSPTRLVNRPV